MTRNATEWESQGVVVASEFAAVRVRLDTTANGPRLRVEDLDGDAVTYLEALELASLCLASDSDRRRWLAVGAYQDPVGDPEPAQMHDREQGDADVRRS
ncbi:hypothetical protein [Euzebya pacifica]|uniref:hypothetical protein n=1 Tax=Euzebya pacifica TaxID=1608957 RepID=UPI000DF783EE|nr:hypothetical protein [Euzebya pacifica]